MHISATLDFLISTIRRREWATAEALLFSEKQHALQDDELCLGRGLYFAMQGQFNEAAEALATASPESLLYRQCILLRARALAAAKRSVELSNLALSNAHIFRSEPKCAFRAGCHLFAREDYRGAKNLFRIALLGKPDDNRARLALAASLEGMRDWKRSVKYYSAARSRGVDTTDFRIRYTRALIRSGRYTDAEKEITELTKRDIDTNELEFLRAEALYRSRQFAKAAPILRKLQTAIPSRQEIYVWLGFIELHNNNTAGALSYFLSAAQIGPIEKCIALTPKEALKALNRIGDEYFRTQHWSAAVDAWVAAARMREQFGYPASSSAFENYRIGEAFWHLGNITQAYENVSYAYEHDASPARAIHFTILATGLLKSGKVRDAKTIAQLGVRRFPTNFTLRVALCEILLADNDAEGAEIELLYAKRLNSEAAANSLIEKEIVQALGRPLQDRDISLVDFQLPPSFRIPQDIQKQLRPHSLITGIHNTARAVYALMLRRTVTQFGNTALGYLWALLQPMILFGVLLIAFHVIGRRVPPGITIEMFLLAGIVPFRLFFQVRARVSGSLHGNRALYYFQHVTPLVSFVSTAILEFLTYLTAFYLLYFGFNYFHQRVDVDTHLVVIASLLALGIFGFFLGIITAVLAQRFPFTEILITGLKRVLFFVSGVFFYANELPPQLRDLLLLNPLFHLMEFIRGGLFVTYDPRYASASYVGTWLLVMCLLALIADRIGRRWTMT